MANEIVASTTSSDQEKFLAARLIQRSMLRLVCASVCDTIQQPEGAGLTANFVRYQRMSVPLMPLTEAVDPPNNTFSLSTVPVTLDQWGDVLTVSDVSQLTTKHPLIQQCIELLADNAQRVIDREIQAVWLAGTNVQYGDGSVTARASITSSMKITDTLIHKARITHVNNGTPPRHGPAGGIVLGQADSASKAMQGGQNPTKGVREGIDTHDDAHDSEGNNFMQGQAYVAITDENVMSDIMQTSTSLGTFAAVSMYANGKAMYNGEVGRWLGLRWVVTNFIPTISVYGNSTAAVTSGNAFGTGTPTVTAATTGGALATGTHYFKVVKKDVTRGFSENISIPHTISVGGSTASKVTFDFTGLSAAFVYDLYFDATSGGGTGTDATILLVQANILAGASVVVTGYPSGSAAAPANAKTDASAVVHFVYILGQEACNWVGLQNLQVFVTKDEATTDNPLRLRRKIAYKFMGKTVIRDQLRLLRLELASSY